MKGLGEREGGRLAGWDSQSCCDLLEYQNPSVYEKAGSGAAPRLALVSIKDKQMGCRRTRGEPAPGRPATAKERAPYKGRAGAVGWARTRTPSQPIKRTEERGLAAPQLLSPPAPSPRRFERRRGPSEPHASDRPPDSFVTATPARGTSGRFPAPPRPRPRGVAPALTQRQADPRGERQSRRRRRQQQPQQQEQPLSPGHRGARGAGSSGVLRALAQVALLDAPAVDQPLDLAGGGPRGTVTWSPRAQAPPIRAPRSRQPTPKEAGRQPASAGGRAESRRRKWGGP